MPKMLRFPETTRTETAMSGRTVLLVEDHPDDEFLALRALRKARIDRVIVKREGCEALNFLRGISEDSSNGEMPPPELVIIDINMPMMNGVEMLREMRADPRLKELPVAILTSSLNPRDIEDCMELGICAYLSKPVEPAEIVHMLSVLDSPLPSTSTREFIERPIEKPAIPQFV